MERKEPKGLVTPKILHFIDSGGLYGAESVILNLSMEMMEDGTFEPIVGCIVGKMEEGSDLYEECRRRNFKAIKLKICNSLLFIDLLRAAVKLKKERIELIHCHGYKAFVFGFIISKLIRVPVLSTCHLWFLESNIPLKMRFMVKCELFLYRFVPTVVCVSRPIKEFLQKNYISSDKIEIINNGINIQDYNSNSEETLMLLEKEHSINKNVFIVFNAGRLSLQKSQETIIDAAELIKNTSKNVVFLIAGDGELHLLLQDRINKKNLSHIVKLLGFRKDIKQLMKVAGTFVLPSLDEGMPMVLLEALRSMVPVIATMVGDVPRVIENGISGIAIPKKDSIALAEAILMLESNTSMCEKLATNAAEKLKMYYSSKGMYSKYKKIYEKRFNLTSLR